MTLKQSAKIPRRNFLRGAGVSLALPMLGSLSPRRGFAAQANKAPSDDATRLVCVMPEYGIHRQSLIPKEVGPLGELPEPAKALQAYTKDISLISGLDHPEVGGGHGCSATFLNGMKMSMTGGERRKMMSFDQYLVQKTNPDTRFLSLGTGHGGPISYNSKGVAIPREGTRRITARRWRR